MSDNDSNKPENEDDRKRRGPVLIENPEDGVESDPAQAAPIEDDDAVTEGSKKKRGIGGTLMAAFGKAVKAGAYYIYVAPQRAVLNKTFQNFGEKSLKGKIASVIGGPVLAAGYTAAALGLTSNVVWNTVADIHLETSQHMGKLISMSEPRYCVGPARVAEIQISTENFGREMSGDDPDIVGNTLYASITDSSILARFNEEGDDLHNYSGNVVINTNETMFTERAWWNPCGRDHRFEVTDIRKVNGSGSEAINPAPMTMQPRNGG